MADINSRFPAEAYSNGADPSVTEIIIVRHGETDWNALKKMQGQADIELNQLGRQQAIAVGDRLSRESGIYAVYTSDLKRAFETANTIASKCGGIQVIVDEDLREKHLGVLQGQAYDPQHLMEFFPEAFKALRSEDQQVPGGGESRKEVYERATSAVQRIGDQHKGERVVVVSHGAVIEGLYKRACPGGWAGDIRNASIGILHLSDGGVWSVKSWNDFIHLNETGALESGFGGNQATA